MAIRLAPAGIGLNTEDTVGEKAKKPIAPLLRELVSESCPSNGCNPECRVGHRACETRLRSAARGFSERSSIIASAPAKRSINRTAPRPHSIPRVLKAATDLGQRLFVFLNFAHRFLCAAAIRCRPSADIVRPLRTPDPLLDTPSSALIAASRRLRSAFKSFRISDTFKLDPPSIREEDCTSASRDVVTR